MEVCTSGAVDLGELLRNDQCGKFLFCRMCTLRWCSQLPGHQRGVVTRVELPQTRMSMSEWAQREDCLEYGCGSLLMLGATMIRLG